MKRGGPGPLRTVAPEEEEEEEEEGEEEEEEEGEEEEERVRTTVINVLSDDGSVRSATCKILMSLKILL